MFPTTDYTQPVPNKKKPIEEAEIVSEDDKVSDKTDNFDEFWN